MDTTVLTAGDDSLSEIAQMLENAPNKHLLAQRIRLSRLKLGSVLDRLESVELGPRALEELNDHSLNVAFEIDTLVEAIREIMGR